MADGIDGAGWQQTLEHESMPREIVGCASTGCVVGDYELSSRKERHLREEHELSRPGQEAEHQLACGRTGQGRTGSAR